MRVILTEGEILMAIEDYVLGAVRVPDDTRVDIDLKATRGDEGYTAIIDLVHMNVAVGAGDRSIDPRIQPTEAAREEGLGIVAKIEEAKQQSMAPRRRGRPKGSTNKPVPVEVQATLEETGAELNQEDEATAIEADLDDQEEHQAVVNDNHELAAEPQGSEAAEELVPQEEPELTEEEQLAAEALATEPVEETQPDPEPEPAVIEEPVEPVKPKASLFGKPAATPKAQAAPAPAPEPESEAEVQAEAVEAEAPKADAPKPRSLFANLTKPVNTKKPEATG